VEVTDKAKELLATKGFDSNLGARPLKRVIQRTVLDPLALKIVSGEVLPGGKVAITVDKKEIVLHIANAMPRLKEKESLTKASTK